MRIGQMAKLALEGKNPFVTSRQRVYAPLKVRRKRIRGERRKAK
jgi:hypothetical protein